MKLTRKEWGKLIDLFLLGVNSSTISNQIDRNIRTVIKALRLIRKVMLKDVPDVFESIVEVDETYPRGQKKNKNTSQLRKEEVFGKESKRGKGTKKQPVFGILCRSGKVFAELADDTEAKDLVPIIIRKVKVETETRSDTCRSYAGLKAAAGYVHKAVEHKKRNMSKVKITLTG